MPSQPIQPAIDLAHRSDFVYVSTLQMDGFPETRVMFNLLKLRADALAGGPARLDHPLASWLGTNTSSQKTQHIRRDPRVGLYYADTSSFEGLSLQGTVAEVLDKTVRAALWTEDWERFYPGGRDGGDFTVLRFEPLRGRYYHGLEVLAFEAGAAR